MKNKLDLVIIGGGPGGMSAALVPKVRNIVGHSY